MCGIFAGCGPVTDGAEQGTRVAVCWLVTRCLAIESGTYCVTSYAQPLGGQQLCSATGVRVSDAQNACLFQCVLCRS